MPKPLSTEEQDLLLTIAANAVKAAAYRRQPEPLELSLLPAALQEDGACFVTITKSGDLRGCIGSLEAFQPLSLDVQQRAMQAAAEDPRFPPVTPAELPSLEIEISRLTQPEALPYEKPADLMRLLRPGVDGVILSDGHRRATFLPQVWEQLPEAENFLSHLCVKMGARADLWRSKVLDVQIYHVQEFSQKPKW